jgi:hypothetical protein
MVNYSLFYFSGGKPVSRACLSDSGFALPQLETVAHCTADALDSLESAREILDEIESFGGENDCNGEYVSMFFCFVLF